MNGLPLSQPGPQGKLLVAEQPLRASAPGLRRNQCLLARVLVAAMHDWRSMEEVHPIAPWRRRRPRGAGGIHAVKVRVGRLAGCDFTALGFRLSRW